MTEVISIQFRGRGKSYYFDPAGLTAAPGELVVVETSKGLELGECTAGNHFVDDGDVVQPLRPAVRIATVDDRRVAEINRKREKEAMVIAADKIARHGLEMKLVDVECSFEGNKILFFFTADGRVDFRELVKDLAGVFRTRIELRQIGVRDEAKMLGGLGICGQPFCCSRFLNEFQPVSTKMAKTQSMSLNPAKISGSCGRLMCCLRYEQEAYEDLVQHVPRVGAFVETADGYGTVTQVNLLRQNVKVRLDGTGDPVIETCSVDEIAEIPGGRPAEGEPLPHLLQTTAKQPAPESREDEWAMPELFAEEVSVTPEPRQEQKSEPTEEPSSRRRRSRRHGHGARPANEKDSQPKPAAPRTDKTGQRKPAPRPSAPDSAPVHRGHRRGRGRPHGGADKAES